jgi:hypothetical protein
MRHGVTNLYAALNVASGKVIGASTDRHRQKEYMEFLDLVERWFAEITTGHPGQSVLGKTLLCPSETLFS